MDVHFLGAANTVTGSQFLLTTGRAQVLIDCGMFQGSPNEAARNRVPLAYEPEHVDAILLTHAHLDHCGLIPHVVAEGFRGPIFATKGTVELAELVLLDSGKLQEEFAKREGRWARKHPDKAAREEAEHREAVEEQIRIAQADELATAQVSSGSAGATQRSSGLPEAPIGPSDLPPAPLPPAATPKGRPNPEHAVLSSPAQVDVEIDEPLYDSAQARAALTQFRGLDYGAEQEVAPGIHATWLDAGHILGSAIIRVRVEAHDSTPERVLVFSGDLGQVGTPILRDPTAVTDADYVFVESTYGGREHEPQAEAVRLLAETVRLVADSNGVLLVPSFAIGRTQEVVWELDRLIERGEIPELPLYLDSPMASKASDVYRHHPDYYDDETRRLLEENDTPLDYPRQIVTNDVRQSQAIERSARPYMIVASNGMLTGGRVLGHLRDLIDDPAAVILFVGYQGEGTLGAHLQAGATTVRIDGQVRRVRCRIRSISGFSAHADEAGLLAWLGGFAAGKKPGETAFPRRVFIVHGDPEAQQALEPKVRELGFDALVPHWHQRVVLD